MRKPSASIPAQQRAALDGLLRGETEQATATRVGKSPLTIKQQRQQLYTRLGAKSGLEAVLIALRDRHITLEEALTYV